MQIPQNKTSTLVMITLRVLLKFVLWFMRKFARGVDKHAETCRNIINLPLATADTKHVSYGSLIHNRTN